LGTGLYLSWSLFESKLGSAPQRKESYAIGVKNGNECWHISNVTDRSATSNAGVSPFTMPMGIDAKTDGGRVLNYQAKGIIRKLKVYMTNKHFAALSKYDPENLCIIQNYPVGD
jgi:hypothetical protein